MIECYILHCTISFVNFFPITCFFQKIILLTRIAFNCSGSKTILARKWTENAWHRRIIRKCVIRTLSKTTTFRYIKRFIWITRNTMIILTTITFITYWIALLTFKAIFIAILFRRTIFNTCLIWVILWLWKINK